MTISSTDITAGPYTTNGATTSFSFGFRVADYGDVEAEDQIKVILVTASTGAETILTRGVSAGQYTVTVNADQDANPGGSVTTITTYAAGYYLYIRLNPSFTQQTELQNQGAYNASIVEGQFDQFQRQVLDLYDKVRRLPVAGVQAGESFSGEITGTPTAGGWPTLKSDLTGYQWSTSAGDATSVTATGSITARTLADRFADEVNLLDWGVTLNAPAAAADNTAAINAAYEWAYQNVRPVRWPAGVTYLAEAAGAPGYCIVQKGVPTRGGGRAMSIIAPVSTLGAGVDIMRIQPVAGVDLSYLPIIDLLIWQNISGTPKGRHGIHLLTDASTNISGLYMRSVYIAAGNDYSLRMQNTGATNPQGVPANSLIENCQFMEGVYATDHGDTLVIRKNIMRATGARKGFVGAAVNDGAGLAGHLIIDKNNIDCAGGAIQLLGARNFQISGNNIEQTAGAGANGAVIDVDGSDSAITGVNDISKNHIGVFGTATVSAAIRVNAAANVRIDDNDLDAGIAVATGIAITASASGTVIGMNRISGFTTPVADAGTNTLRRSTVPVATVDNTLPRYDAAAGALQASGVAIDDSNNITGINTLDADDERGTCANLETWHVLAHSAVQVSHTGDTNETALATIAIPAGAMGANGCLRITAQFSATNSGNNKVCRIRLNGASGTVFRGATMTTQAATLEVCQIANRNSQSAQVGHAASNFGGWGPGSVSTATIDTSAAVNLVISGQLANSGETVALERYMVEVFYKA